MNRYSYVPEFVLDNLDSLKKLRRVIKMSSLELAKATGIDAYSLRLIEEGSIMPTKADYNILAKFMEWEEWN